MATSKQVSKKIQDQQKVNHGDAINKRIIEKGRAINYAKSQKKK